MPRGGHNKLDLTPEERKARVKEQVKKAQKKYKEKLDNNPELKEAKLFRERTRRKKKYHEDLEYAVKVNARSMKRYYEDIRTDPEKSQQFRDRVKGYQRKSRTKHQEKKIELQQLLGGKCVGCGLTDHRLLDFDHINPVEKLMNISQYIHLPIEILLPEINKCQLMCPNCHRIKTLENRGNDAYKNREFRNKFRSEFKSLISLEYRDKDKDGTV